MSEEALERSDMKTDMYSFMSLGSVFYPESVVEFLNRCGHISWDLDKQVDWMIRDAIQEGAIEVVRKAEYKWVGK